VGKIIEPPMKLGKYGGSLTEAMYGDPRTLNLWVSADANSSSVVSPLYSGLIELNPYTLEWEPALAQLPSVSADGLTWTVRLKDGLRWSDGHPITADDIIFTLNVIYDPKVATNYIEGMLVDVPMGQGKFKRAPLVYKKLDRRTVQFKFPVRYSPARSILNFPIAPKHKLEAAWRQGQPYSTAFNAAWGTDVNLKELVSSGPWIISQFKPGELVVYTRNPHYWKKDARGRRLPYLDRFISRVVSRDTDAAAELRAGRLDVLNIRQDAYRTVKAGEASGGYKVYNLGPGFGSSYLSFNLNMRSKPAKANPQLFKLFNDVRFRQAVSHAVDRRRIVRDVYGGLATPAYGPESPASKLFYTPNIPRFEFNLKSARRKLAAIGLRDTDGDGYLNLRGGKPLRFNIITNIENEIRVNTANIIANDLNKIGIEVIVSPLPFNNLISRMDGLVEPGKAYPSFDWQAVLLGFTGGLDPNDARNIWMSSGNMHQWEPYQEKPRRSWEAQLDELFRKGAREINMAQRKAIYAQYQRIVAEQQPLIYTVVPNTLVALRNKFGNVKPSAVGGLTWNSDQFYDLKATRQRP
jgi:peptide/nickel transport system substrate-binding protein